MESQTTAPTSEPLTIEEAKQHTRVSHSHEDALFTRWISAAREYAETWTGRQFMLATWQLWLPSFWPHTLELPHAPLSSISAVRYYDADNAQQTWAASNYAALAPVGPNARPGRLDYVYGITTPETYSREDAVEVEFVAGYANAAAVPSAIKAALLLLVSEMNERREQVVVGTIQSANLVRAEALLAPFAVHASFRWSG